MCQQTEQEEINKFLETYNIARLNNKNTKYEQIYEYGN